eukprot:gnl/MRDRNA2_/MRDRNA2_88324_c0_seq1.p1 gnl/MRDRNA2_/MRDRNA2_88324_c0~~gnl/MRDRNA2_/MRDRNA2_88324_c0_seq1.p1  ORF type:complete len:161 (+),score=48.31 gnl/MRDRNA2_/MRDRNA2_88324_c0_seq1:69-551(+)
MMRAVLALAPLLLGVTQADEEFRDTPTLSSLWEATSKADNAAIDRILDDHPYAVKSRASDGRGLAWWGYEFKNAYVLASINALGGDFESADEDLQGAPASSMCPEGCDLAALKEEAVAMIEDIKTRAAARAEERAKEDADDDADFDTGSGTEDDFDDDEF